MSTKTAATFFVLGILLVGIPGIAIAQSTGSAGSGSLSPAQLEKVEQIEATLASESNHPFRRLWEIFSRTSVTGFVIDRLWNMFQEYSEQRRYREATELKEQRMWGTIKEAPSTSNTKQPNHSGPTSGSAPALTKPSAPAGAVSGSKPSGGTTIPSSIPKSDKDPEEEDVKTKLGSTALTAFTSGVEKADSWLQWLLGK